MINELSSSVSLSLFTVYIYTLNDNKLKTITRILFEYSSSDFRRNHQLLLNSHLYDALMHVPCCIVQFSNSVFALIETTVEHLAMKYFTRKHNGFHALSNIPNVYICIGHIIARPTIKRNGTIVGQYNLCNN